MLPDAVDEARVCEECDDDHECDGCSFWDNETGWPANRPWQRLVIFTKGKCLTKGYQSSRMPVYLWVA